MRFSNGDRRRRAVRGWWSCVQLALFSVLVLGTRCANYGDVFVDGKIYFVDADCYSRMTRARLVAEHPGLVVRHHDFENYPDGITPHTTSPMDYLIVLLAVLLRPFTAQPLDLAGAIVSPVLGLAGGWFLWWWSGRFSASGRLLLLSAYALSGILVHGTALGRPDQQSLLIVTLLVAVVAEWRLQQEPARGWSVVSGASWGLALWVSFYEPLILLGAVVLFSLLFARVRLTSKFHRPGWCVLLGMVSLAGAVERRLPEWSGSEAYFSSWSSTIGELRGVAPLNPVWLHWLGGLLLVSPILLLLALRRGQLGRVFLALLVLSFGLTLWQSRWGYFCALLFLLTLPAQLTVVRPRWLAGGLALLALWPFLQFWDTRLWPNDETRGQLAADRRERMQWRAAATSLAGPERAPILAPWWLAPATAYWSGQPVVAGSSHESLPGVVATSRFFLADSPVAAADILERHGVKWVLVADGERVTANSAAVLGHTDPERPLALVLDRRPSQAPYFLTLAGQNDACKIYRTGLAP